MSARWSFWGCPDLLIPDNLKTGVLHPCRYEPDLNPTYQEMAAHYGMAVIPARVRKPRDKAKVEAGVLLVERWILAALRKRASSALPILNQAIAELLERLNHRPFRKLEGSRATWFLKLDRPALRPLPAEPYHLRRVEKGSRQYRLPHRDRHHYYSAPYCLFHRQVDVRYTAMTVEIFHRGQRVASHARSYKAGGFTTINAHRPKSHQRYLEWTPQRLVHWASTVGPSTARWSIRSFNPASSRTRLPQLPGHLAPRQIYGHDRLEAAARRASHSMPVLIKV